jgi:hypothetical protein
MNVDRRDMHAQEVIFSRIDQLITDFVESLQ